MLEDPDFSYVYARLKYARTHGLRYRLDKDCYHRSAISVIYSLPFAHHHHRYYQSLTTLLLTRGESEAARVRCADCTAGALGRGVLYDQVAAGPTRRAVSLLHHAPGVPEAVPAAWQAG